MAHGDAQNGKWRGNWRMEWVASNLHTTSEHGVSSITTADAYTSASNSRLNWRPPADLNGLVRFAERRNLVSARVPSHFNWPLLMFDSSCLSVRPSVCIYKSEIGGTNFKTFEIFATYPRTNIKLLVNILRNNGYFTGSPLCTSAQEKFNFIHWLFIGRK
jgi:hypothetical protein